MVVQLLCQRRGLGSCYLDLGECGLTVEVEKAEDDLPRREIAKALLPQGLSARVVGAVNAVGENLHQLRVNFFKPLPNFLVILQSAFLSSDLALYQRFL